MRIHDGRLVLINHKYPLVNYQPQLTELAFNNTCVKLDEEAAKQFKRLINDLGIGDRIVLVSGFRDYETQKKLYDDSLLENGREYTDSYVAFPAHSEHQAGLAIDIGDECAQAEEICPSFMNMEITHVFKKYAPFYGFIERYKSSKTELTKIAEEPWHYRYVGYPHSLIMNELDFCLEEYIAFLQEYTRDDPYHFSDEKAEYLIYSSGTAVCGEDIVLSGNNCNGYIATQSKPRSDFNKERSYREISLENLAYNVIELQKIMQPGCQFMAVVKADAYGHGAVEVAHALQAQGISQFAVATLEEAIELRKNLITGNILILGYVSPEACALAEIYNLLISIVSLEHGLECQKYARRLRAHLKINTGMNRYGLNDSSYADIKTIFNLSAISIEAIYSHFSCADTLEEREIAMTNQQVERFDRLSEKLEKSRLCFKRHLQASYGLLNYNNLCYDYVRIGAAMFGFSTNDSVPAITLNLKPVLSLYAQITEIRNIEAGESIGYSLQTIAGKPMRIAVVSIGYSDGISTLLSTSGYLLLHGCKRKVVGKLSMDSLFIDLENAEGVQVGDKVTLIGKGLSCEVFSKMNNKTTIEQLTSFSKRIKFVFE